MPDSGNFRQKLDAVLRTCDVKQVRTFLIALDQWSEEVPADPERAMWMMVAGTPTLRDLHERARTWLEGHGYGEDALAILGKSNKQKSGAGGGKPGEQHGQKRQRRPDGQRGQRSEGERSGKQGTAKRQRSE